MEKLQKKYADDVEFLFVYTKEAHPDDGISGRKKAGNKIKIDSHMSYAERVKAAKTLRKAGKEKWRVVVDDMKSTLQKTWGSLPNNAFLIDPKGEIAQKWAWVRNSTPESAGSPDQDTKSAYKMLDAEKSIKPVSVGGDRDLYLRDVKDGEWITYTSSKKKLSVVWNVKDDGKIFRVADKKEVEIELREPLKKATKTELKSLEVGKVGLPCVVVTDGDDEIWYCGWLPGDGIARIVQEGAVVREVKDAGFKDGESCLTEYKPE
jgi:hypothetical protein